MVKRGYVLLGFVLETLPQQEHMQCKYACAGNPSCKSINMEDKDIGTCELNEKGTENMVDGDILVPRAGWIFSSTDYNEMNVSVHILPKSNDPVLLLLWKKYIIVLFLMQLHDMGLNLEFEALLYSKSRL